MNDDEPRARGTTAAFLIILLALAIIAWALVPRIPPRTLAYGGAPVPTLRLFATPTAVPTRAPTPEPGCRTQAQPLVAQLDPLDKEWTAARAQAGGASSAALPGVVTQLQGIRAKVEGLKPPPCAQAVTATLLAAMAYYIQAYQGFAQQLPEADTRRLLVQAAAYESAYNEAMRRLRVP